MFQVFTDVLTSAGAPMAFDAFVTAVRVAGGRPENWLKAKHEGILEAHIVDGAVRVGLPGAFGEVA